MKALFLTLLICFLTVFTSIAQNSKKEEKNKKKEEQYQQVIALVESMKYNFIGRKAIPQKGPQIDLTTRQNYKQNNKMPKNYFSIIVNSTRRLS